METRKEALLGVLWMATALVLVSAAEESSSRVPALFVLGDSTVDTGNNNELWTVARATYLPYGRDFDSHQPTGRFTNGRISIDYLAELLGLPLVPPYLTVAAAEISKGVNFASAGSGILNSTGEAFGEHIPLPQQVANMAEVRGRLISQFGLEAATALLRDSIFYIAVGSNDIIQSLVTPPSQLFLPDLKLIDTLVSTLTQQVAALHQLGARKIAVSSLCPLGLIPSQVGRFGTEWENKLPVILNSIASIYNQRLFLSLFSLSGTLEGLHLLYNNAYTVVEEIARDPQRHGFLHKDESCCAVCLPHFPVCENASQYMFWDGLHPTSALHSMIVERFWSGGLAESFPINLQQLSAL